MPPLPSERMSTAGNTAKLSERYETVKGQPDKLQNQRQAMDEKSIVLSGLIFEISELYVRPLEFNKKLWNATIDHVAVYADARIVFSVKGGTEIGVML